MATRSHLAFYETPAQPLDQPNALIYRHWDGYPEAVLPLVSYLAEFEQRRGMRDVEYLAARTLGHFLNLSDPDGVLGYGIADSFHGDIECVYAIYGGTRQVVVYEVRHDGAEHAGDVTLAGTGFTASAKP